MNLDLTAETDDRPAPGAATEVIAESESADGRRARRERNMASVVEALLELFHQGQLHPTAQQLADRSGVSLRSVFRYFDDMQDLTVRAFQVHLERVAPMHVLPARPAGAPLDDRIETIATHRARLYVAVAPVVRAASLRFHRSPELAEVARRQRSMMTAQSAEYFAPELDTLPEDDRLLLLSCIDTALQLESGENLCERMGLPADRLADAYRLSLTRLLSPFA